MKTTIDIPEELLIRAKVAAAQRKTTLKELVIQGLHHALEQESTEDAEVERKERKRKLMEALSAVKICEPVGKFNREEIYDRHQGKWEE